MRLLLLIVCSLIYAKSIADEDYHYFVNLNKVNKDRLSVTLIPPDQKAEEVEFCFPAMVPGTYEVYDFGRFVSNFKVIGKNGANLKVLRLNSNTYRIKSAGQIEKITYDVDDTFDKNELTRSKGKIVFEPGGSNFEENKNFSINTFCLFGYIKGQMNRHFVLEFEKPKGFYPATGLSDIELGEEKDILKVKGYHELADSPIMYAIPDTTSIVIGKMQILVAAYAPRKKITSNFIANTLREVLYAQSDYLGGELPVNKYAFLFYFNEEPTLSGSNGALEHSYSSFYVMPEFDSLSMQQQLRDVSAHEFFHIVTPLTIHSKEIGDFDFNDPKMSEHLWLYEGMTEYAAHHAQVKAGIIDINEFMGTMMQKYEASVEDYNDTMSFTYMSKHVLESKIHPQYGNVYEKGAVIGMCLDILLRDLSNGEYGTQNLMKDLALKYGKNQSFNDEELFSDIEKFTYPQIGDFLRNYVGGNEPLPMKDVFDKIGVGFMKEETRSEFSLGNPDLGYNPDTKRLYVESTKNLDEFGKMLKYKNGDEFAKLNGREIGIEELKEVISEYYDSVKEGDQVTLVVMRPNKRKTKYKEVTLTAKAQKVKTTYKNKISVMENASDKQRTTLKSWLGV